LEELDKKSVINIFNALGISVTAESFDCQRLQPKRNQTDPHPILVKLKPKENNFKAVHILKMAKKLKDLNSLSHISISPDLFKEQRMVQKKLVIIRKELNKKLREDMPDAAFYFSIYNGRIVKKSKYMEMSEKCNDLVNNLISEAISSVKSEQTTPFTRTSIITLPLLNKVIHTKIQDDEHKQRVRLSERITRDIIKNINNQYYWSDTERLCDKKSLDYTNRLMELESRCATIENQIKEFGGKLSSSTLYTGKEVAAIDKEVIERLTEKFTGLVMDCNEKLVGAIKESIDVFGNAKIELTELIKNMGRSNSETKTEICDLLTMTAKALIGHKRKLNFLYENMKVKLNFDQSFEEEPD